MIFENKSILVALYNSTSLEKTEFQTYFNRILSIMLFYNQYSKPEEIDDIGQRALKEYFSTGSMDGDTHSNAVNVMPLYLIVSFSINYIESDQII